MDGHAPEWVGPSIVVTVFAFSLLVSIYHIEAHDAPLLPTILGQWSLVALSLAFGAAGYYGFANVDTASGRWTVGLHAGAGYVLAGLASGAYSLHQYLTPEAALGSEVILFQATFMGLVGGLAGVAVGVEKARRKRSIADLEAATNELEAIQAETRTEKERFESLFRNAPSAIADLQYSGDEPTLERANPVFEDLLEDRYEDDLDEDAREFIAFAVDGADRMQAMIESLLEYSRVTTRGDPLEPTDAEGVLDDVLRDLQPRIEETDATVTIDDLPTVTADADQLAQIFRNLISNALKYSGDDPPQVHVDADRTDTAWRFTVTDQGSG